MPYYEYEEEYRSRSRPRAPRDSSEGPIRMDSRSPSPSPSPSRRSSRARSVPAQAIVRRARSVSTSSTSSSRTLNPDGTTRARYHPDDEWPRRSEPPLDKARSFAQDNFTNSATGIGAGLLGAVVGGLVARSASDGFAARRSASGSNSSSKSRPKPGRGKSDLSEKEKRQRVVSTILGAVAGGVAANALANRLEDSRDRTRVQQAAWEARHGPEEDLPHYDNGRSEDMNHGRGPGRLERGRRRYEDDYERVEFDEPRYMDERRLGRRRSDESYRYRN